MCVQRREKQRDNKSDKTTRKYAEQSGGCDGSACACARNYRQNEAVRSIYDQRTQDMKLVVVHL